MTITSDQIISMIDMRVARLEEQIELAKETDTKEAINLLTANQVLLELKFEILNAESS